MGVLQAPGRLGGLQEPPGASRGLQAAAGFSETPKVERKMRPPRQRVEPWARPKFHAGWSGWTRPPAMRGGGAAGVSARGSRGGFKGI